MEMRRGRQREGASVAFLLGRDPSSAERDRTRTLRRVCPFRGGEEQQSRQEPRRGSSVRSSVVSRWGAGLFGGAGRTALRVSCISQQSFRGGAAAEPSVAAGARSLLGAS